MRANYNSVWLGNKTYNKKVLSYRVLLLSFFAILLTLYLSHPCFAVRIKDIARVQGMRINQLVGYGLVVGLDGSGDGTQAKFTLQSIANMMERMGINVDPQQVKVKNAAGVMVTANLPTFTKPGQRIDCVVSSIGDAKSLQGGTLLMTPLKGPDGMVYAIAQGPISIGGIAGGGRGAGGAQKNHPTVGRIPNGAVVERTVNVDLQNRSSITYSLFYPDITTVSRMAEAINDMLGQNLAYALDPESVRITIPPEFQGNVIAFLSRIESIEVDPDTRSKVVLDERTGTVVMGEGVKIRTVAISHGNLSIQINSGGKQQGQQSQQGAQAAQQQGGQQQGKKGKEARLLLLNSGPTIGELVKALNAVGVTPQDLISILQSIKAAGALQAEIEVI